MRYVYHAVQGDLGVSMTQKSRTVVDVIGTSFPVSMHLGLMAFVLAILIGIPAGIIAALKHNTWADYGAMFYSTIGWAVPVFIIGPVAHLHLLGTGSGGSRRSRWEGPSTGCCRPWCWVSLSRPTSHASREAACWRPCSRTTCARPGPRACPTAPVVTKHVLRNSLIPVVTQAGPLLGFVITGSFLTEYIFAIPGLGKYYVSSVGNRDYSVVMGLAVLLSVVIILANLLVDILYGVLDPRIRYE